MGRKKKESNRTDGRVNVSFRYEGKVYTVTAPTKEEAVLKKRERIERLKAGAESRQNPTLDEYYARFAENRKGKASESTLRTQSFLFKAASAVQIEGTGKSFGTLRMRDIQVSDIQAVQRTLSESMTTSSVNLIISHVGHVFRKAMQERVVDWNPVQAVDSLQRTEPKAIDTNHRALTPKETSAFFKSVQGNLYENVFKLMIQTGMRCGEVGALMVSDFDMKENVIHITKTVTRGEDNDFRIGPTPKTDAGFRDIPMNEAIKQIFKDQLKLNEQLHGQVQLDKPVFMSFEGHLLTATKVNAIIKRTCESLGMEVFCSHSFRDTFATRFIEQRPADYKILSEILGHASVSITLNLYCKHQSKDLQQQAMTGITIAM